MKVKNIRHWHGLAQMVKEDAIKRTVQEIKFSGATKVIVFRQSQDKTKIFFK